MENEIIEMEQKFEVSKILFPTEKYIQAVENEFKDFPTDMTVPENYALIKAGVKKVKKYLTATEKYRKSSQAKALKFCQDTNAVSKILSGRFSAVNDPMVKVVTDHETKEEIKKREIERLEKERQENIENKINNISRLVSSCILSTADEVKKQIDALTNDDITSWADEYKVKVVELKNSVIVQLGELYSMKIQAETAKVAAEKAEKERIEKEKEEQEKRNAEQKAIRIENAKLRAENEKDAAKLKAANKIIADQKLAAEKKEAAAAIAEQKREEEKKQARLKKEEEEKKAAKMVEIAKQQTAFYEAEAEGLIEHEKIAAKIEAENAEADKIAEKKAVDLTTKQLITQMMDCLGNVGSPDEEEEAFIFFLIKAIKEDKFNHIKWVN